MKVSVLIARIMSPTFKPAWNKTRPIRLSNAGHADDGVTEEARERSRNRPTE